VLGSRTVSDVAAPKAFQVCGWLLLGAAVTSSVSAYPHFMSYFNEAVGGPANGPRHLLDSNIDWGQDILSLRDWVQRTPHATPIGVALSHWVDPNRIGIPSYIAPRWPPEPDLLRATPDTRGPRPGWYAISVSNVYGYPAVSGPDMTPKEFEASSSYRYFRLATPVCMVGHSIYIYHLSSDDVDRIRREIGAPPLDE
jgi:hypothetical protein